MSFQSVDDAAMPVLALDVDDVLGPYHACLLDWYNTQHGTKFTIEDLGKNMLMDLWKRDIPATQGVIQVFHYSSKFRALKPFPYAQQAITTLASYFRFVSITARQDHLQHATREWLGQYFPEVGRVVFARNVYNPGDAPRETKEDHCKQQGARRIVEDSTHHLEACARQGIHGVIFDQPWNRHLQGNGYVRVINWQEAEEVLMELYRRHH